MSCLTSCACSVRFAYCVFSMMLCIVNSFGLKAIGFTFLCISVAMMRDSVNIIWKRSCDPKPAVMSCWSFILLTPLLFKRDRLVGLVIKASASRAEDPGFESRLRRDFVGVESYQ